MTSAGTSSPNGESGKQSGDIIGQDETETAETFQSSEQLI